MELKYCECCGGLLLRPAGTSATYCAGCAARIRELAPAKQGKRRGRPPVVQMQPAAGEDGARPAVSAEAMEAEAFAQGATAAPWEVGEPLADKAPMGDEPDGLTLEAVASRGLAPRRPPQTAGGEAAQWRTA